MLSEKQLQELCEIRVRCRELARTEDYFERRFSELTGLSEDTAVELLFNRPLTSDAKFQLEVRELVAALSPGESKES